MLLPPPPPPSPTLLYVSSTVAAVAVATIAPTLGVDVSTVTQAVADAVATSGGEDGPHEGGPPNGECRLLGPFAILVQGALGLLALSSLVFKRWRERPQRPVKVWAFDVSKQVVGSVLVHIANLLMSMLSSGRFSTHPDHPRFRIRAENGGDRYQPNPCAMYLLNLAIDTTIGIPILIVILRVLTALFLLTPLGNPPESLQSGHYGHPPRAYWWFKQSILYFFGLMGMKFCVLIIFLALPWISHVGDWMLKWTEGNEEIQVFFVMLLFPLIMNAAQYYIIDSFIKSKLPEHEQIEAADPDAAYESGREGSTFGDSRSEASEEIQLEDEGDIDPEEVKVDEAKAQSKWKSEKKVHSKSDIKGGDIDPRDVNSGSSSERGQLLRHEDPDSEDESKPAQK